VRDLLRLARINQTRRKPIRDPEPLFHFAQGQNATVRRQPPAVEFDLNPFATDR